MYFEYFLPTRIVFGAGSIGTLSKHLKITFPNAQKIFLVTGRRFMNTTGLRDKLIKMLETYDLVLFDNVEPGPSSNTLDVGIAEFNKSKADIILAIGGGSVMDLGKAIAILAKNPGRLADYQSGVKPIKEAVPFVAIPTTIGSASEMTTWSVVTNKEGHYVGKRKSFSDPKMYPRLAIIDPSLSLSLPAKETMETALDILSASIESYWSKKRNPISSAFALSAIQLSRTSIPWVMHESTNVDAREQLGLACLYSGLAVSNSRTGMPHKISYPLSTHYKLAHGAACMLTLPYFLEFFGMHNQREVSEIVAALGVSTPREAADSLRSIVRGAGMPTRLSEIGVDEEAIEFIIHDAYIPKELQEDPVSMSRDEVKQILRAAL